MIKVKVCGMLDPLNIEAVAGTGPDYLGFIFYPGSKRFVGTNPDESIFRKITSGILKVGVFVNEKPERVIELANRYAIHAIQLHGSEPVAHCKLISSAGFRVIKSFGIDTGFDYNCLAPYLPVCEYFIFDTKTDQYGGTGLKFNWSTLNRYGFKKPFFLSGGIGPEDIKAIRNIHHPAFYAVDINSRFEITAGIKDIDKIKTFIKEIKTAKP